MEGDLSWSIRFVYATTDSVAASRAAEALIETDEADNVSVEVTSIPRRDAFFYAEKP